MKSKVRAFRDSKLRATMEGIIEREILAGAVCRFETQILSGKLKHLVGIPKADTDEAERILKRCHETTGAHNTPIGKHTTIPTPSDLLNDINAAEALRVNAIARR